MCLIVLFAFITQKSISQTATAGDYRSAGSGNWSINSTWQVRDGSGNWTTPSTPPTASNNVYIQSLHQIIVDVSTASCNDLHLQTTDSLAIGSNTLEVSGKIRTYNSFQISTGALTSNVVTITTSVAHGLTVGTSVIINGLSGTLAPVNGTYTIATVPTSTTFTYALTNANITSTTSGTTTGSVTRSGNAVTSSVDGTFYTGQVNSTAINTTMCTSTNGVGTLKFIGNTRNITNTGEWTGNSVNFPVDVVFALSSGQTGTINTVFGGRSLTFSSGTTAATTRLTPSGGAAGTGSATIKNGATLTSSVTGTTQLMSRTSTSTFGTFTIEAGGTLEVTGSTATIDAKTIVNNGNVVYNRGGSQTLLAKGASTDVSPNNSADFNSYTNLTLKSSTAKTIPSGITINVSGTLTLAGSSSCILASTGGSSLTYSPGATLALSGTSSIGIGTTNLEWPASNGPTNILVTANTLSFVANAGISRVITGNFTLNGGNFTVNTGNTLTFGNGARLYRSHSTSAFNANSGTYVFGTAPTDVIYLTINPGLDSTITSGNEFVSNPVGTYGSLTIGANSNYRLTGGRTFTDLNNSGKLILAPTSTMTLTINGNLSGSGTISGHDSASITIGGVGNGSSGSLNFTSGSQVVNNLTVDKTGTNGSVSITQPITINRNLGLSNGTLSGGTNVITLRGGVTGSGVYTASSGGKLVLNGTTNTGTTALSSATLANVELASNGYYLAGSPTITGTFDLKSFVLTTNGSTLAISSTGNIARTNGWVFGNLRKNISTGNNVSRSFEIGDSLNYLPATVSFSNVSVAGDFAVKTVKNASLEPNYATSPLSSTNYVNRYWSTSSTNGLVYTDYSLNLNYISTDLVGTATSASVIAAKYFTDWTISSVSAGTYSNTLNNVTSTGNFLLGKCGTSVTPSVSISTASNTVCSGSNVSFNANATNGGSSPNFEWFKNGGSVGSSSSITFLSGTLNNNDVISCVLTANNTCQTSATANSNTIQLTVNPSPAVAQITNSVGTVVTTATMCTLGSNVRYFNTTQSGSWSSDAGSVASVDSKGVVTANSNGTATISYSITSANSCVSSSSLTVTVAQATTPNAITGTNQVCVGNTTTLATTTTGGVWSSSNNRGTIDGNGIYTGSNAGAGVVRYTVTNANSCSAYASYNVTVNAIPAVPTIAYAGGTNNPQAGAPSGSFCVGKTFTVVGSPNSPAGVWSATGVASVTSGGVVTINAVGAGSIKYTYTSTGGCSSSRTISGNGFTCAARGVNTVNNQLSSLNDFTIYPNPAKSVINLKVETLVGTGSITITDLYGKILKNIPMSMGNNSIDIANLTKGMYFVSMITNDGKKTQKIIVE